MSPARDHVRERGTCRAAVVMAVVLAAPLFCITASWDAPAIAQARALATAQPAPISPARVKPQAAPKKDKPKRKPTIEDIIRAEFGKRADEALRVARCESKLDPKAHSRAGARGVFQIMPVHAWRIAHIAKDGVGKDLWDAKTNIRVARALFKDEGWRPWVCARIVGLKN